MGLGYFGDAELTEQKLRVLPHRAGGTRRCYFSCGNGAVEAQVQRLGFRVLAIDAMQDAVDLAHRKGIEVAGLITLVDPKAASD